MRNRLRSAALIVVPAAVAILFAFSASTTRTSGQVSALALSRTADGKPDFSGIWQANNTANWDILTHDSRPMVAQQGVYPNVPVPAAPVVTLGTVAWIPPGMGVVEGDTLPYQPWAAARQKENLANWLDRDPELSCFLPGLPRAMYLPFPFQILQGTNKVMMIFEFADASRTINLDKVAPYPNVAYMGFSLGR
jgi:hypothetical protein